MPSWYEVPPNSQKKAWQEMQRRLHNWRWSVVPNPSLYRHPPWPSHGHSESLGFKLICLSASGSPLYAVNGQPALERRTDRSFVRRLVGAGV